MTLTEGVASPLQTFAVALDRASTAQVTVRYTTTASSALAPEDFSLTEGLLTFAPGVLVANVGVPITDDDLYEGNEAFAFVLSDATNARIGRSAAVGRIVDDESPPTLLIQAASLVEGPAGGSELAFELTLSAVSGVRASVDYATVAQGASEGGDYSTTKGVALFQPGTTTVRANVPVVDDSIDEFDEQLWLQFSSPSELVLASPFAVGTIIDDDPLPILSIGDAVLPEAGGILSFLVHLSAPSGKPVTVQYSSSNMSAAAGADYAAGVGTLDFQPGDVEKAIAIPIVSDSLYEGQETFLVTLSSVAHATLGQVVAVGTILDDDPPPAGPPAAVTVSDASVTEGDSGTASARFSVQLSEAESDPVSVDWVTIAGTATAGADFVGAGGTLIFPAGTTTRSIDIDIVGDDLDEDDETFRLVLSNAAGNIVLADGMADAAIVDDDAAPTLNITNAVLDEGVAGGTALEFTVSLSAISGYIVTVDIASADGTAGAGADYVSARSTLTFAPGETTKIVHLMVLDDPADEGDETLSINLSNAKNASIGTEFGTGTITDNDAQPALSISDASVNESDAGGAVVNLAVTLSEPSGRQVSVDFATGDGTAVAGSDYAALAGTLIFNPGETVRVIAVSVMSDLLHEANEFFAVSLAAPEFVTISDDLGIATIMNDDSPSSVSIADIGIVEGNSGTVSLNFSLTLSSFSTLPVAVSFATADGTAIADQDYTSTSGTVNFAPGEIAKSVSVQIIGDTQYEADESFTVGLSNAINAVLEVAQAQGAITNDDSAPMLNIDDVTQLEGSAGPSLMNFTVQLTAASGLDVNVEYSASEGSATAGLDYTAASGTLVIPAGETSAVIGVTINGDTLDESNESFSLILANSSNAGLGDGAAQGGITDDDAQPSVSISSTTATEGVAGVADLSFSINLSAPSGRTISVDFASSTSTAQLGQDFTGVSGTLTFTPGQITKNVAVVVLHDMLDEDDETMQMTLSNAMNASIAVGIGTGTITDNDAEPSLTITDGTVTEGDSGAALLSFTLALSAASGKEISVSYATQDGTANAGEDYLARTDLLTFNPGVTSIEIAVDVLGDLQEEEDETLLVGLSAGVNASIADASATGTITNDDDVLSWGLDSRPSNLTCIAPNRPVPDPTITLGNPFRGLPAFSDPVALAQPPGDDSLWFIVEKPGRVSYFSDSASVTSATVAIDITNQVADDDFEQGLLGMAIHPSYSDSASPHVGEIFLSYTATGPISRVSRFKTTTNWATWTEEVIVEAERDFTYHNGGNIAFGPDGYLYVGWGDGGGYGDPFERGQSTTDLLGAVLRLDVDGGVPYAIPGGNPFSGNPICSADHSSLTPCPEIYAWGFRNPWRWSFDTANGDLWLGDVGQGEWEEINIVEVGGNYGWDVREGAHCHEPSTGCDATGLIEPVAEYDHDMGLAVVGGFVYRGSAIPELFGRYVFADPYGGRLWALENDGQGGYSIVELLDSLGFISSFAQGNNGELYILDFGATSIRSIVSATGGGSPDTIATSLSETGCFNPLDPTVPASGLIPYSINAPFWSDGADKDRYLAIPDGTTITVGADDDWTFPPGSVIVKNFRLDDELFETRLLMRHPDGVWAGYTYEWNEDGTDATRVIGGKTKLVGGQPWIYPSEGQCDNCHTLTAGFTLGLESAQLNRDFTYQSTGRTANQLATLDHLALFSGALPNVPHNQPRLADPANTAESLSDRARAYLYTNCAQCHRPLGPAPSSMDLRFQTPLNNTSTCNVLPAHGDLGIANARLIVPGAAANSIVINRMSRRDAHGMPPLASNFVDLKGAALLTAWVNGLSNCL